MELNNEQIQKLREMAVHITTSEDTSFEDGFTLAEYVLQLIDSESH